MEPVKLFDRIVKGGPWALVVIIMLVWLAGDYGLLESQSKIGADLAKSHSKQMDKTNEALDKIVNILEEQRIIQARTGLLVCLKDAKSDMDRTECVRKYPIQRERP